VTGTTSGVQVVGTGSHVPERVVPSSELEDHLGLERGWIEERTGIRERRFAAAEESTSDLAARAAEAAFANSGRRADRGVVICATSTPDWSQPATAAQVHRLLGLPQTWGAFDLNAACSGFVHAYHVADCLLAADPSLEQALVIGADCYSRITNPDHRSTRVLFGDGAGALVLERSSGVAAQPRPGLLGSHFGTTSEHLDALIVPGGGARQPLDAAALEAGANWFAMDGPAVRSFAEEAVARAIDGACTTAGVAASDLSLVVLHQSNRRILEAALSRAGIDEARTVFTVETLGNTAAASVAITLDTAVRDGRLGRGDLVCLAGYGGGLSEAAVVLRW
jgi:acetoacetyl-CoA synthase